MVAEYFHKSFRINITKTWVTTDEPKFNGPKKPLEDKKKLTVSGNVSKSSTAPLDLAKGRA
jgi:hypothetical protein